VDETEASEQLNNVEKTLEYQFRDRELLETALSHCSYAFEQDGGRGNERLEFLGDAVLDLVIARRLFELHPDWSEGDLTRARAALVNTKALAMRTRELGLAEAIRLGKTERRTGGVKKDSILGNVFEAVIGAMYLDAGLEPVERFVARCFTDLLEEQALAPARDVKTRFQEWAHAHCACTPRYRAVSDSGRSDDSERFVVEVLLDERVVGRAAGRTKRIAERAAAEAALAELGEAT